MAAIADGSVSLFHYLFILLSKNNREKKRNLWVLPKEKKPVIKNFSREEVARNFIRTKLIALIYLYLESLSHDLVVVVHSSLFSYSNAYSWKVRV